MPGFVWINVGLTILWFVTVTNAVQFLDGMDGLAAGLGVIAGIFISIAALQTGQRYLMYLSAALVGACLGFLPYNFRPGRARIFLGDGGATFIGFTLAGLAVMGEWADQNSLIALLTPALAERPLPLGTLDTAAPKPMSTFTRSGLFTPFTPILNATGQPGISVPLFEGEDGLPLGVQLVGRAAAEGSLLALAAQLEEAQPWAQRRAPMVQQVLD